VTEPITVTPMDGPFGAEVTGITGGEHLLDAAVVAAHGAALAEHRILRIHVPPITDAEYARFGATWGAPIDFFRARDRHPDHPELICITNSEATPERLRDGAMHWHHDSSYEQPPASVTMLRALETPAGNETRFADMVAAHEALDPEEQAALIGLMVRHQPAGGHPDLMFADEARGQAASGELPPEVQHPLVIRHPASGRPALYGLGGTATGIAGRTDATAIPLLRRLKEHATASRFEQRARAEVGTILVWDNLAVMHCATPTHYSDRDGERRLVHRISTRCTSPLDSTRHQST